MADPSEVQRRLVAVFAADVEGYSRLMGADEVGTLRGLTERRVILDKAIADHRGRIANTAGDSVLAEFGSAVDAVQCAVTAQAALAEVNTSLSPDKHINFRIGIHVGDVMIRAGDLFGDGVNIAARLQTLAAPGALCVSGVTYDQVRKVLPLAFTDLGAQQVKNIEEPVRAWALTGPATSTSPTISDSTKPLPLPDKPSIAVLPFQNMSGDPEQEYFADGMIEDIITALSRFRSLFVIARNSSFTYKGKAVDVKQVARELGVRYILEGSVRKSGNRVRVTAQLIDATSGAHVWADRYDRDLSDIFALQDEITASVAGVIEPALSEAEQQHALRKPPERLDAWEAYQRGLWHFHKDSAAENETAQKFFRRAIELDPKFAPGHYGYSQALQWDVWLYSSRPHSEIRGLPLQEARTAVSLDDRDAMAHACLAHCRLAGLGEWEAAMGDARTALLLNPNSAFVIGMVGCVLTFSGYHEEALARLQQATRASPHDPLIWLWTHWSGMTQFYARKFDDAARTFSEVVRLRPGYTGSLRHRAASLAHLGRLDEARDALQRARALGVDSTAIPERPPYVRPEDWALHIEARRKLGLPK